MNTPISTEPSLTQEDYQEQHKHRLSYMPWLYHSLKPKLKAWAKPWQQALQDRLSQLETLHIGEDCFIAPNAHLFAEPGRDIHLGNKVTIAAEVFLHGPAQLGDNVAINHNVSMDGGSAGIRIGSNSRIACQCTFFAFNHGMAADALITEQAVSSQGISIGEDVWIGANCAIVDGITIGNGAVIGMGSVVTQDIPEYAIAVGNPARVIGDRRNKPDSQWQWVLDNPSKANSQPQ